MKITDDQIMDLLDAFRVVAIEGKGYAPALKAIELMGRHIGMWRDVADREPTLAELIAGTPVKEDKT